MSAEKAGAVRAAARTAMVVSLAALDACRVMVRQMFAAGDLTLSQQARELRRISMARQDVRRALEGLTAPDERSGPRLIAVEDGT